METRPPGCRRGRRPRARAGWRGRCAASRRAPSRLTPSPTSEAAQNESRTEPFVNPTRAPHRHAELIEAAASLRRAGAAAPLDTKDTDTIRGHIAYRPVDGTEAAQYYLGIAVSAHEAQLTRLVTARLTDATGVCRWRISRRGQKSEEDGKDDARLHGGECSAVAQSSQAPFITERAACSEVPPPRLERGTPGLGMRRGTPAPWGSVGKWRVSAQAMNA